jgi:hypothetical protein
MKIATTFGLAALVFAVAGCSDEVNGSFTHLNQINKTQFAVHRHGGPDAIVSKTGELSIAGAAVNLDPAQKALVSRYFDNAIALRDDGFATGMACASTAITALSSVVNGLASGEPDKIGTEVEAKAAQVEAKAMKICGDLHDLATTQNALSASLPAFRPYALISEKEVDECRKG